jgi:hypothetical protein
MTSLKCWNSGVESKAGSFITLPTRSYACRAPCLFALVTGATLVENPTCRSIQHTSIGVQRSAS